ncbi:MAG: dihydrodipicolinate synthase family protein [Gemmatimonadota bacterium]
MPTEPGGGEGDPRPEGFFLPVTTPFHEDSGELDREAFRANLRGWTGAGVDGVVVAGSTGEAPLLDEIEILRLTEWASEAVPRGRAVVAGTGLESTRGTVRLCREVARNGADAALVRPPCYYRGAMSAEAVEAHFRDVADASPVPVILYNIPRYVPVELEPEVVGRLARHGNVVGIKDSSGDIQNLGALVEACGDRASVLVGAGTLFYGGLEVGARGGVLAVGLLATEACCEILRAWRRDDDGRAGALQERVGALHRAVVGRHGVAGVKEALDRLGMAGGPVRAPLTPLDGTGREHVAGALASAGRL